MFLGLLLIAKHIMLYIGQAGGKEGVPFIEQIAVAIIHFQVL